MAYKILYKASVKRDLKKIPKLEVKRILNKIENDLGKNPNKGELLKGKFQGLPVQNWCLSSNLCKNS